MSKISQIITNRNNTKYIIIVLLISILISIVLLLNKQKAEILLNPDKITPGRTTAEELIKKQQPFNVVENGQSTEYYIGDPQGRNNTTYTEKNGVIEYYLERNRDKFIYKTLDEYEQEFGEPNFIRYNDWFTYGKFVVYVFLKPGIAVTANPESKVLIEEWHLTKGLNETQFNASYNTVFYQEPPVPKNQF